MKVNQLGALAIVGVVVSFTVACDGSPTKPTALSPALGDAASAASVNVSKALPVGEIAQTCTEQTPAGEGEDGQPNAVAPVICDSSAGVDQPPADVVVSDSSPMDTARFVRRLHR